MPTVKRFEDLHVWQSARELVKMVYRQLSSLISYLVKSRHASIKEPASEYTINSSDFTNLPDF